MEKLCVKCNTIKPRSEFFKVEWNKKFKPYCKDCSYYKHRKVVPAEVYMYRMYNNQRSNARGRDMDIPTYSFEWFKEFLIKNGFNEMYQRYLDNNKLKDLAPSVDRINPLISYTEGNIQLMTWKENNLKSVEDKTLMGVQGGLVKVIHYTKDKTTIYNSIQEASIKLNVAYKHIESSCNYRLRKYPKGIFRYYKPSKNRIKELSAKLVQLLKDKATPHGNKGKMSEAQKAHLEVLQEKYRKDCLERIAKQGYSNKERLYKIWFRANREFDLQDDWKTYLGFKAWAEKFGYNDSLNIYRKDLNKGYYEENLGLRSVK